jgi:hypothetical protein
MPQEEIARSADERLTELELKVDDLSRLPLQNLALAPSNCCNSCNNVRAALEGEGAPPS